MTTGAPFGAGFFGFVELNEDGESYYGKAYLNKQIFGPVNALASVVYQSGFKNDYGIGVAAILPTPTGTFLQLNFLPLWIDSAGRRSDNRHISAGYVFSVDLAPDIVLSGFADFELDGETGFEWGYGELKLAKSFGSFSFAYHPGLIHNETHKANPDWQHRFSLTLDSN